MIPAWPGSRQSPVSAWNGRNYNKIVTILKGSRSPAPILGSVGQNKVQSRPESRKKSCPYDNSFYNHRMGMESCLTKEQQEYLQREPS
jgi:hypothetical protein